MRGNIFTRNVVVTMGAATTLFLAGVIYTLESKRIEEQAIKDARTQALIDKHGVFLRTYDTTVCINGWLVISFGTHQSLYARDKEFKPIPCVM